MSQHSDVILSGDCAEDVHLFLPLDRVNAVSISSLSHNYRDQQRSIVASMTKQIRAHISVLTKPSELDKLNIQIADIIQQVLDRITMINTNIVSDIQSILDKEQQLQTFYTRKLKEDENTDPSIFAQSFIQFQADILPFLAVQSTISILLVLIKSSEKNDPTIVYEVLRLADQLVEQIPMKYVSSDVYKRSSDLFKSLKPLTNYINELSLQTEIDPHAVRQAVKILLSFSIVKASFKDILSILSRLIFNTTDVYDIQRLFIELNNCSTLTIKDLETMDVDSSPLVAYEYLKSIEAFPSTKLMKLDENKFTGQFISSILLAHIDLHNQIQSESQFEHGSFSFEFHPDTYKQLFDLIERLTMALSSSNTSIVYMLTACLRLFTTHLHFLITSDTNNDLQKWFATILTLALNNQSEEISKEASKALIYLINKQTSSFSDKLSLMHKYIVENKHPILIEQLLIELHKYVILQKWIDVLCNEGLDDDKTSAFTILHSLIGLCLKLSPTGEQIAAALHQVLLMFQELILVRLNNQPFDVTDEFESSSSLSILVVKYTTHIITYCTEKVVTNDLLEPLIVGLYTLTESKLNFPTIQSIFTAIVPLLAEYLLQTASPKDEAHERLMSVLLGKMSSRLIAGSPESPLETKHVDSLKSLLFAGGCETTITQKNPYLLDLSKSNLAIYSQFELAHQIQQSSSDSEFLMSVYNNIDQGGELISKMKMFVTNKQYVLEKTIGQQANDACATVFAVYIKHYHRIDLAKHELSRPIDQKPHDELLSIYEYANYVQTLFTDTSIQDFNELNKQIKCNALVLLESVRVSHFISTTKKSVLNQAIITYLYGNITSRSVTSEDNKIESDELIKCLIRQHERALIRLVTYRFIHTFIEKVVKTKDDNRAYAILVLYLPHMKNVSLDWHYLESIPASNIQLKEDIGQSYFSIIKIVTSFILQSKFESTMRRKFVLSLFHLMNVPYDSMDLCHLHRIQIVETLFTSFVSFIQTDPVETVSLDTKLTGHSWFRMFVLELCENIKIEELTSTQLGSRKFHLLLQRQRDLVFRTLILNELKSLAISKQTSILSEEYPIPSLNNASIGWFIAAAAATKDPSTVDIGLCMNQLLMLLLRCIHLYDHVKSTCATADYIEQLLNIYYNSQHTTTRLLALKILRDLLTLLPEDTKGATVHIIETFLTNILFDIGQNSTLQRTMDIGPEILTELIDIYRTLISQHSPWQRMATKLVINAVKSSLTFNLKSLESVEERQMSFFLASLCILGGYIRPYCLGSVVQIYADNKDNKQLELAIIMEIDRSAQESYCVQSVATNKTEWVMTNKLHLVSDVPPLNLMLLPTDDGSQDAILDTLAYLAQIDTSRTDSLMLLQIKRRSVAAFYSLLNTKQLIEIFMQKSYASVIAKLSISSHNRDSVNDTQPTDFQLLNKFDLEQYSLSLDICERTKRVVEDDHGASTVWNDVKINRDPLILNAVSTTISKYNGWKPHASKAEIELFEQGRTGNGELNIIPFPSDDRIPKLEECGQKHKFKGRINIPNNNGDSYYPCFIVEDLQLTEGKWYYCVRVLSDGLFAIGWASTGFNPYPDLQVTVASDEYSWGYNGLSGFCGHNNQPASFRDDIRWKEEDVCGCGIEINGKNTVIKYWLNGELLGTAFSDTSNTNIESANQCNMLPNGSSTSYFPSISVHVSSYSRNTSACELIFGPEDMVECPLPKGYKPLLVPKLINIENCLVAYPYSAYLVGNDAQDCFHSVRRPQSDAINERGSFLRDFVNDHHLLKLSEDCNGLPFSIDNQQSLTISFDFEILPTNVMADSQDELDIILFTLENDLFSIQIPLNMPNDEFTDEATPHRKRIAIIFQMNEQTKIYINNERRILNFCHTFDPKTKLNFHILPHISAEIKNLSMWKYALSEEHIRRLFMYGLSYVAADYRQLKEHRREANTFTFTEEQKHFTSALLVPFNQPFETDIWEKKKKQADHDESIYFRPIPGTHQSVIQLFGNKTYLVLDTSANLCSEYTLILDIFVPNFSTKDQSSVSSMSDGQLTFVNLDTQSEIFITLNGYLCTSGGDQSASLFKSNEYIRLVISLEEKSLKVYVNGSLELHTLVTDEEFKTKCGHIELFRETEYTKNTISEDQLRIECKSITFFNKPLDINRLLMTELIDPPFSILSWSLMAIGYKKEWIKFVIKYYKTTNSHMIDTIIREQHHELLKAYLREQQHHKINMLSRLTPYIDKETSEDLMMLFKLDDDIVEDDGDDMKSEKKWCYESVCGLNIRDRLCKFNQDEMIIENDLRKKLQKSIQYFNSRSDCEHRLATIYARDILVNMFQIWSSDDQSTLFPLEKFGDTTFIVKLLRLVNCYSTYARTSMDETVDGIRLIIRSILKAEVEEALKNVTQGSTINELLKTKAPLLYELHKYVVEESIQFLIDPSLLDIANNNDESIDEQTMIKQLNLDFFFKIINLFLKLLTDNSMQQHQIDLFISFLFPALFIKVMFDLFLLVPSHQSKIIILHIFTT
jgi:hypothetical protein